MRINSDGRNAAQLMNQNSENVKIEKRREHARGRSGEVLFSVVEEPLVQVEFSVSRQESPTVIVVQPEQSEQAEQAAPTAVPSKEEEQESELEKELSELERRLEANRKFFESSKKALDSLKSKTDSMFKPKASVPYVSTAGLTRRLVAAVSQFEVRQIMAEAGSSMARLRIVANSGDSAEARSARAMLKSIEKLLRRAQKKISDLDVEGSMRSKQKKAETQRREKSAREIKEDLRKKYVARKARENGYLMDTGTVVIARSNKAGRFRLHQKEALEKAQMELQLQAETAAAVMAAVAAQALAAADDGGGENMEASAGADDAAAGTGGEAGGGGEGAAEGASAEVI